MWQSKSEEYRFKAEGIANPTMDFLGMRVLMKRMEPLMETRALPVD